MSNKPIIIESQLDCRATASLNSEVENDLNQPDVPMSELIASLEDTDENKDEQDSSTGTSS
jgi:hypothetical protein